MYVFLTTPMSPLLHQITIFQHLTFLVQHLIAISGVVYIEK